MIWETFVECMQKYKDLSHLANALRILPCTILSEFLCLTLLFLSKYLVPDNFITDICL